MAATILIADDDPVHRRLVEAMIQRTGHTAVTVDGGEAAMAQLGDPQSGIDAVILDLAMPGLDGLGVLEKMREAGLDIPVIVQTAHGGIDNVVAAMRAGACDFMVKPVGAERLMVSLRNALDTSALKDELHRIRHRRDGTLSFADIVSRSETMAAMLATARKAAASTIPVLIEGESGVGKELVARAIHGSGERRSKPFVAVNCGAIPDNLVESILFGHEKGSFTGATERHAGKFVEASGGTLFLDEVSELPLSTQVKLLRALQESEVEAVGGKKPVRVDVRIISATNRSLLDQVKQGHFREDLFYRLHVLPLTVPPLRNRRDDIPVLVRHFLARIGAEERRPQMTVDATALQQLCAATWPGNVRQLENACYRAIVMSDGTELRAEDFPQLGAHDPTGRGINGAHIEDHGTLQPAVAQASAASHSLAPQLPGSDIPIAPASSHAAPHALPLLTGDGEIRPLEDIETEVLRFALVHYRGQMSEIARRLKIGRSTLYRKLETLEDPALNGSQAQSHD
jgi:DNA-binding NtrC family response regulator